MREEEIKFLARGGKHCPVSISLFTTVLLADNVDIECAKTKGNVYDILPEREIHLGVVMLLLGFEALSSVRLLL